jgi:hypothetical protein
LPYLKLSCPTADKSKLSQTVASAKRQDSLTKIYIKLKVFIFQLEMHASRLDSVPDASQSLLEDSDNLKAVPDSFLLATAGKWECPSAVGISIVSIHL